MKAQWAVSDVAHTSIASDRDPPHTILEQLRERRCIRVAALLGLVPLRRLRHGVANPQHDECRQYADQEHVRFGNAATVRIK